MIKTKFNFNRAAAAALLFSIAIGFQASARQKQQEGLKSPQEYRTLLAGHQKVYEYPSQERIDRIVDSVFRKLTPREKIAQIMIIEFDSKDGRKRKEMQNRLVKREKIGGLIPMNDDLVPAMKRMNELNRLAKVPMLITIDAEWGASMRYWDEIPQFPRQMQLGALSSDSLVYRMGYLMGKECRLLKMQVNYAPDIDINNNPSNPAINTRSFGENKDKVAQYGIAIMQGMKDAGVAGSAKHFPGHGDTDVDSHLALPVIPFDYERLDTLEMYPFKHLIAADVDMVMVAHLNIPALDPSGTPSSISRKIVTELLREKLGFKGIICTDALNMHGVARESGLEKKDIPLAAYKAGADILLMPEDVENSITVIEQALKNGEITMAGLDERVKKVLSLKAKLGLFDKGYSPIVEMEGIEQRVIVQENLNLMQQIAKNSMTLLYNDNSKGLGIPVSSGKKIAYLGYRKAELGREFAAMAMKYAPVDTVILGNDATLEDLKAAKKKLQGYDLIITGFNDTDQRPHRGYGINEAEYEFITEWAGEQPMIAVYLGSPYALAKIKGYKNFTALVLGYINTPANNFAAAQVVFGGIPAIGVLPVSAADYPVGHSIVIPDRVREEYFNLVGSEEEKSSCLPVELDKQKSACFTLLAQACHLIGCGKASAADFGENLVANPSQENLDNIKMVLDRYNYGASVVRDARDMLVKLEMRHTEISDKDGKVKTTASDMDKFLFMLDNGGKYAGNEVICERGAALLKKLAEETLCR